MSKWSAMAALGEMAKGGGQYYGTLYAEGRKSERLAQARAEKIADRTENREWAKEDQTEKREYAETIHQGRRVEKREDAALSAQAEYDFDLANPSVRGTTNGKDGTVHNLMTDGSTKSTGLEYDQTEGVPLQFKMEEKVGKELTAEMNKLDYNGTRESWEKIQHAAKSGNHMSDTSMIFYFMKTLDPTSVVRESEFATVKNARAFLTKMEDEGISVPTRVVQMIQSFAGEGFLTPEMRQQMVNESRAAFESKQARADAIMQGFEARASTYGLDRERLGFNKYTAPVKAGAEGSEDDDPDGNILNFMQSNGIIPGS